MSRDRLQFSFAALAKALPPDVLAHAHMLLDRSSKVSTKREYASKIACMFRWLQKHDRVEFPVSPETLCLFLTYVTWRARASSSFYNWLAAINLLHAVAGVPSPTKSPMVRALMQGIRRQLPPKDPTEPITTEMLKRIIKAMPNDVRAARDRCALLIAYAGALHPYQLAGLRIENMSIDDASIQFHVEHNSHRRGVCIGPARDPELCPILATRHWLDFLNTTDGPLLRKVDHYGDTQTSGIGVVSLAHIFQKRANAVGITRCFARSLRKGAMLELLKGGVSSIAVMHFAGLHRTDQRRDIFPKEERKTKFVNPV